MYWAADVSGDSPHADGWVSSRFELDKCPGISLGFRDERSTPILIVAFRVTDVQHLLKGDCTFVCRLHQVNLTQHCIHGVKATSMTGWLVGRKLVTSLTNEQPNGHGPRGVRPVGAADDAKAVVT